MTQYVVPMYESERGWGSKIDGYAGPFGDIETANKFRSYYNKANNSETVTPDWYIVALEPVEHKGQKCEYVSAMPDQEQAMTTPTQTEYGPEIVVDRAMPDFLKDGEHLRVHWALGGDGTWSPRDTKFGERLSWHVVDKMCLPATHPYYTVLNHNAKHGTQFKYWPGGDEPDDWNAGEVLLRNGNFAGKPVRWTNLGWPGDIIGYTPKPCAPHPLDEMVRLDEEMVLYDDEPVMQNPEPDFVPCERTVLYVADAVKVEIEREVLATLLVAIGYSGWRDWKVCDYVVEARITRDNGDVAFKGSITPDQFLEAIKVAGIEDVMEFIDASLRAPPRYIGEGYFQMETSLGVKEGRGDA